MLSRSVETPDSTVNSFANMTNLLQLMASRFTAALLRLANIKRCCRALTPFLLNSSAT